MRLTLERLRRVKDFPEGELMLDPYGLPVAQQHTRKSYELRVKVDEDTFLRLKVMAEQQGLVPVTYARRLLRKGLGMPAGNECSLPAGALRET